MRDEKETNKYAGPALCPESVMQHPQSLPRPSSFLFMGSYNLCMALCIDRLAVKISENETE